MACATLKRSLEWDSLNQRPSKRRRCNPFGSSSEKTPQSRLISSSSLSERNETIYAAQNSEIESKPSAFKDADVSTISPDQMAQKIRDEIKRLHRRKDLYFSTAFMDRMQDSESSGSEMGPDSPRRPESPGTLIRHPEKALFTFKQVQLICERMLKEREEELREKYDSILAIRLAEQYDAFVKFTYDQIQRRYEAAPSYLS